MNKLKIVCELEFTDQFSYAMRNVKFFINHFLISPIVYEESTLINLGFLIRKDFWYIVLILDFTGICIAFIGVQNFSLS